ncbi:MAG TPA: ribosome-associated translation inhibitor RaiA [Candidatus Paceibacterota bacterium]|jgi:ribosomal subunit interface protein|nr:ribosome-associated translation inhibitor RaiA [Candidatus Paceibacterota bacterium]
MSISIKTTLIELTPALSDYTEKRLSTLTKYTESEPSITVEIGKTSMHHRHGDVFRAEVNVTTALGKQYRAVSEKTDLYEAIDDTRAEIIRELKAGKARSQTLFRRGATKIKKLIKGM